MRDNTGFMKIVQWKVAVSTLYRRESFVSENNVRESGTFPDNREESLFALIYSPGAHTRCAVPLAENVDETELGPLLGV